MIVTATFSTIFVSFDGCFAVIVVAAIDVAVVAAFAAIAVAAVLACVAVHFVVQSVAELSFSQSTQVQMTNDWRTKAEQDVLFDDEKCIQTTRATANPTI